MKQARADVAACARYFEFYGGACDKLHGDDDSVSGRLHGADLARAARRHRPHHSLELSAADLRPLGRRRARRRQRLRRQAGRGRLPVAAARRRTCRRRRLARRRAQHRHRTWPRGRRRARRASRASITSRSRDRRRPARGRRRGRQAALPGHARARRQGRRRSCSPTPTSTRRCRCIVNAIVQNAGQTCSAGSRLLVERSRYEEVLARLGARFAALRVGPALADLDCGPLIRAVAAGARARFPGRGRARRPSRPSRKGTIVADAPAAGYYVEPHAAARRARRRRRLGCEEVFGPVLAAMPFADEADAVRIANATEFGLVAGVWTQRRRAPAADGARDPQRTGVRQQLRRRRRRRAAVRRRQALGLRPRKGLRGAVRFHGR